MVKCCYAITGVDSLCLTEPEMEIGKYESKHF